MIVGAIIIAVVVIGMVFLSNKASAADALHPPTKAPSPLDAKGLGGSIGKLTLAAQATATDTANRNAWLACKSSGENGLTTIGLQNAMGTDWCGAKYGYDANGNKLVVPERSTGGKVEKTIENIVVPFNNWF